MTDWTTKVTIQKVPLSQSDVFDILTGMHEPDAVDVIIEVLWTRGRIRDKVEKWLEENPS